MPIKNSCCGVIDNINWIPPEGRRHPVSAAHRLRCPADAKTGILLGTPALVEAVMLAIESRTKPAGNHAIWRQ
jgi:hypothetical protein